MVDKPSKLLNQLNQEYSTSSPENSVKVTTLIREHEIESPTEVAVQVGDHIGGCEECECVSSGFIRDFAKNLYEAQFEEWGRELFPYMICYRWMYNLFTTRSLDGVTMEDKIKQIIDAETDLDVVDTGSELDIEYMIDFEVEKDGFTRAGIQVKPLSYKGVSERIKSTNRSKNEDYPNEVIYVYYDKEDSSISNREEVLEKLTKSSQEVVSES